MTDYATISLADARRDYLANSTTAMPVGGALAWGALAAAALVLDDRLPSWAPFAAAAAPATVAGEGGAGMTSDSFRSDGDAYGSEPPRPTGLLDMLSVAAVVLDADGRIVFWTPQAEELFGYRAEEVLGEEIPVVPDEGREQARSGLERLATGETIRQVNARLRHKDGHQLEVLTTAAGG